MSRCNITGMVKMKIYFQTVKSELAIANYTGYLLQASFAVIRFISKNMFYNIK